MFSFSLRTFGLSSGPPIVQKRSLRAIFSCGGQLRRNALTRSAWLRRYPKPRFRHASIALITLSWRVKRKSMNEVYKWKSGSESPSTYFEHTLWGVDPNIRTEARHLLDPNQSSVIKQLHFFNSHRFLSKEKKKNAVTAQALVCITQQQVGRAWFLDLVF